jgi:hypothetical protein
MALMAAFPVLGGLVDWSAMFSRKYTPLRSILDQIMSQCEHFPSKKQQRAQIQDAFHHARLTYMKRTYDDIDYDDNLQLAIEYELNPDPWTKKEEEDFMSDMDEFLDIRITDISISDEQPWTVVNVESEIRCRLRESIAGMREELKHPIRRQK